MVYSKTRKRKALNKRTRTGRRRRLPIFLLDIFFIIIVVLVGVLYKISLNDSNETFSQNDDSSAGKKSDSMDVVDFQPLVNEWVNSTEGNKSVIVYDLGHDVLVGEFNPDVQFDSASLYKLFVVYEGYRRLQTGEWGSDDLVGATGRNIVECLDLSIRESNSECAEALLEKIGYEKMDDIVEKDYGIKNTSISKLQTTSTDVLEMMKLYYHHPDIADDNLISHIKDSLLNQPKTEYNWRQGLPSGFNDANVYNKVGWDFDDSTNKWRVYHDAAIVEFSKEDRVFAVVVMTENVPFQKIKEFGTKFEQFFNKY